MAESSKVLWYGVRSVCLFKRTARGTNVFEERVVVFFGATPEDALRKAIKEVDDYVKMIDGVAHPESVAYELAGAALSDGYEVWSELFESAEDLETFYRSRFVKYAYRPEVGAAEVQADAAAEADGLKPKREKSLFQKRKTQLYLDLAAAVLAAIPDEWNQAQLTFAPIRTAAGGEKISHDLFNPELPATDPGVVPGAEILTHTKRLALLCHRFGAPWSLATFVGTWSAASGEWRFDMKYQYED